MVKTFSNQLKTKDKRIAQMREEIKMLTDEHSQLHKEISLLKLELEMPTPGGRFAQQMQPQQTPKTPTERSNSQ